MSEMLAAGVFILIFIVMYGVILYKGAKYGRLPKRDYLYEPPECMIKHNRRRL